MSTYRRNVLSNAAATVLGSIAQLIFVAIVARLITKDIFAEFVTAAAFIAVGEITSDFGTRVWAVRNFALDTGQFTTLPTAVLSKSFYTLGFVLISIVLPLNLLSLAQMLLCATIAMTQPSTDPLLWFLRGRERFDLEAIIVLAYRILNAIILCGVIFFTRSLNWLLFCWLLSNLMRMLCENLLPQIRVLVRKSYRNFTSYLGAAKKVIVLSFPVGVAFMLIAVYQRLGVFILGIRGDSHLLADYGVAFTLVAPAGFLATSITVSAFPRLARAIDRGDYVTANRLVRKKLMLITAIFVPCCLVGLVASPIVIDLLYGARYQDAGGLMVLMLSGLYISSVTFALKYTLNSIHLNWWDAVSVSMAIGIFLFIVLNAPPGRQAQYAAAAWCLGEGASFLVKWFALRRDGRIVGVGMYWVFMLFTSLLLLSFYASGYAVIVSAWWRGLVASAH